MPSQEFHIGCSFDQHFPPWRHFCSRRTLFRRILGFIEWICVLVYCTCHKACYPNVPIVLQLQAPELKEMLEYGLHIASTGDHENDLCKVDAFMESIGAECVSDNPRVYELARGRYTLEASKSH